MTGGTIEADRATATPRAPARPLAGSARRRVIGLALLAALAAVALAVAPWARFDTARADMEAATRNMALVRGAPINEITSCFQGFCFEGDTGRGDAWREFVGTYGDLMVPGVLLGLAAAGIVVGFLLPRAWGRGRAGSAVAGLVFVLVTFTAAVAVVAVLALLVPAALGLCRGGVVAGESESEPVPWGRAIADGVGDAGRATGRLALQVVPLLVAVVALGAYLIQHLDADAVDRVLGDHPLGIGIGVVAGLVLPLPGVTAIALAVGAILIGMGPASATAFLVAALIGGPLLRRRTATGDGFRTPALTALLALVAGCGVVGWHAVAEALAPTPTVVFDGEACTYTGPSSLPVSAIEIRVENDTTYLGTGLSMGLILGRLPAEVTLDQFRADTASLPAGVLPDYFVMAGEERFVFPDTGRPALFVVHNPGTYAFVCTHGGGGYVVREFSMYQPQGWFDEFRETFERYIAPVTVEFTAAEATGSSG